GMKFDLSKWDEAYFRRLKEFVAEAGKRGVVMEFVFFNTLYNDTFWNACPLNAKNNVNGVGDVPRMEAWSLQHPALVAAQEAMVRKVVAELKAFDNLYYEGCNEPYERRLPEDWQNRITETIAVAEAEFPSKHLIAQNVGNGLMKIANPHPSISIFNYHYANPPDSVGAYTGFARAIGFDETGGRGQKDHPYRTDAWSFILAGGAVYSHLDYSFSVRSPEGNETRIPGHSGGTPALRGQLAVLKEFIHGFDFVRMKPDRSVLKGGIPPGAAAQALVEPGKAYAVYLHMNEKSSVRWTGQLVPKHSETYTFSLFSNDGARLFLDGKLLVDNWGDYVGSDLGTEKSATIALEAGRKVALKIEYYDRGGNAACRLSWSSPNQKKEVVPASGFLLEDGSGPGLKGEYFEGAKFEALRT
ncbi:MAG: PA14 domain-containing protein, partial [Thermoplasmata archaeon]